MNKRKVISEICWDLGLINDIQYIEHIKNTIFNIKMNNIHTKQYCKESQKLSQFVFDDQ